MANTLPFSDVSSTGTNVLIKGVDSTEVTSSPLHSAYLSSDLVSGHVVVGFVPSLLFDGVHLLLGDDLACSKVDVTPLVTDKSSVDPFLIRILLNRKFPVYFRLVLSLVQ